MPATPAGTTPPACARPLERPTVFATTTTPAIPILLNVTSHAGFSVEWMMPDTGGTAMQLANPRGTPYLLFSVLLPYSADWLTMGVINPHRFGLHGPAATFDEFVTVARAFIAAIDQTNAAGTATDTDGYPRIPLPRDPNESYRRRAEQASPPPAAPLRARLARLRPRRRAGGRHRLHKRRAHSYRPTAPLDRVPLCSTAA